jgi:hypothetical protein
MKKLKEDCVILKNKIYKRSLGIDTSRSDESTESKIFQYSALQKIADVIEKTEPVMVIGNKVIDVSNSKNEMLTDKKHRKKKMSVKLNEEEKDSSEEMDNSKNKTPGSNITNIVYHISEDSEETEKISFEEYLNLTGKNALPALLIDIFIYLGAKKYVDYVLQPKKNALRSLVDAQLLNKAPILSSITIEMNKKVQKALMNYSSLIGEEKIEFFHYAFKKLAVDPSKPPGEIYATLESIMTNFKSIFLVENEFFAK